MSIFEALGVPPERREVPAVSPGYGRLADRIEGLVDVLDVLVRRVENLADRLRQLEDRHPTP